MHDFSQINIIEKASLNNKIKIWIKIDTGMNRLGFHIDNFQEVFDKCKENKKIEILLVL